MTQSATAFGKIQSGLSFFRNAYSQFASYNAAIIRLHGLAEANDGARRQPTLTTGPSPDGSVQLDGVAVHSLAGDLLIDPLDLRLERGESMVITGVVGQWEDHAAAHPGPTVACRRTAGGARPAGDDRTMFVSQLPYLPLGDVRAVLSYPARPGEFDDVRLRDVLTQVSLAHLRDRLGEEQDWAKVLSPGEQQRIAFARVVLHRPDAVFLDEATSAVEEGLEFATVRATAYRAAGHHRGQRRAPQRRRTAPPEAPDAARRRCLAAGSRCLRAPFKTSVIRTTRGPRRPPPKRPNSLRYEAFSGSGITVPGGEPGTAATRSRNVSAAATL